MEAKHIMTDWAIELFINTDNGQVPLSETHSGIPLPQGPDRDAPLLHYGPYLKSISAFFAENQGARLLQALKALSGSEAEVPQIRGAALVSEKHGALYQVARLVVSLGHDTCSLAVNAASTEQQKAFLEAELELLGDLHARFHHPYLPRPLLKGSVRYGSPSGEPRMLDLLVTEWFEGFSELHLSCHPGSLQGLGISVWETDGSKPFLSPPEEEALYREAAAILTAYFDTRSFGQIYPWHHAAGDFVVCRRTDPVSVRLITARGYRSLGDFPASDGSLVIAALHFFVNLSLRMRLDRLDGTGELAWAGRHCLKSILEGFARSWTLKRRDDSTLPSADHLFDLLAQFSRDDWISFGQLVLEDGMVERDETEFLACRLVSHLDELSETVHDWNASSR